MFILFFGTILVAISLWWGWPVFAGIRAQKHGRRMPFSVLAMLQVSALSVVTGFFLHGPLGGFGGLLFPPYWPAAASFYLWRGESVSLPMSSFFNAATLAAAVTLLALLCLGKLTRSSIRHSAIFLPGLLGLIMGMYSLDRTVQSAISARADALGATCLTSKPVWISIREAGIDSFQSPHAQARLDDRIINWSFAQQDFFTSHRLSNTFPATWCPKF